jgi:hypothetical protein
MENLMCPASLAGRGDAVRGYCTFGVATRRRHAPTANVAAECCANIALTVAKACRAAVALPRRRTTTALHIGGEFLLL